MPDVKTTHTSTESDHGWVPARVPSSHHPRPWRRGSIYGTGTRRLFLSDQRRMWLARANLERLAKRLTSLHVDICRVLIRRLGEGGQCDPSHHTIAADAGCSERTVRRALRILREVGLLTWEQRVVQRSWPAGGRDARRLEQTSNAYLFTLPTEPVAPPPQRQKQPRFQLLRSGGHPGREIQRSDILRGLAVPSEAEQRQIDVKKAERRRYLADKWLAESPARQAAIMKEYVSARRSM